jgi:uncharacterized protein YjbJ (UPF0337 family)
MNLNQVQGNWMELHGNVKEIWGKLTNNEIAQIAGKRDILFGKIQEKYGIVQEKTRKQIKEWEKRPVRRLMTKQTRYTCVLKIRKVD